jgi:hypothetical protein
LLDRVKQVISVAFGQAFSDIDRMVYEGDNLKPKHGPGATADSLKGNEKWLFGEWTERLEQLFPFVDFCIPNHRWWEESQGVQFLGPHEERPVKLTAVPKTASTPRLIAEEPTAMQYMQQAIRVPLCDRLEADPLVGPMIGFTRQEPNRWMAQIGSEDKTLATLDLSEASDRVGNWIVESLFEDFPFLSEALQATRSRSVLLPSGEVIQLRKFASMGSALTFPVEAIVFLAITIEAVLSASGRRITHGSIRALHDQVRVYGDDIIVPVETTESVIESLELFGFKVNRHKSFWNGWFRESCGEEFWGGHDVSIVRSRRAIPQSRRDVAELVSLVEMRNHFASGEVEYSTLVELIDAHVVALLGHFPWVLETSPVLGRVNRGGFYQVDAIGRHHHAPLVKGWVKKPVIPINQLDGRPALMKCLSSTIGMQDVDKRHLQRSGRPLTVSIKLGMARPF